jgi:actin-related protein
MDDNESTSPNLKKTKVKKQKVTTCFAQSTKSEQPDFVKPESAYMMKKRKRLEEEQREKEKENKQAIEEEIKDVQQNAKEEEEEEEKKEEKDSKKAKKDRFRAEHETACGKDKESLKNNKKRGRKPKGGKIISCSNDVVNVVIDERPNIILHLKCFLKDLEVEFAGGAKLPSAATVAPMDSFSSSSTSLLDSSIEELPQYNYSAFVSTMPPPPFVEPPFSSTTTKQLAKKLNELEHNLHTDQINYNSACFWDTCEFDNSPVYIPKFCVNDSYHVYGCFCSPECATAYLMNENIDSSTKFERYQLLNNVYGNKRGKKITPAPNPHYTLEKFCGNLSIQEYRALLQSDRFFMVVNKPLTRIAPELVEYNDEFMISNKIIQTNVPVTQAVSCGGESSSTVSSFFMKKFKKQQ